MQWRWGAYLGEAGFDSRLTFRENQLTLQIYITATVKATGRDFSVALSRDQFFLKNSDMVHLARHVAERMIREMKDWDEMDYLIVDQIPDHDTLRKLAHGVLKKKKNIDLTRLIPNFTFCHVNKTVSAKVENFPDILI